MKNNIMLLNKPYGYNEGTGIKLIHNREKGELVDYNTLLILLLGFSCHPPAIKKIYNSLKYMGEYSCFLQASWFKNQYYYLQLLLNEIDIELEVFFYTSDTEKNMAESIYKREKESSQKKIDIDRQRFIKETQEHFFKTGRWFLENVKKNIPDLEYI